MSENFLSLDNTPAVTCTWQSCRESGACCWSSHAGARPSGSGRSPACSSHTRSVCLGALARRGRSRTPSWTEKKNRRVRSNSWRSIRSIRPFLTSGDRGAVWRQSRSCWRIHAPAEGAEAQTDCDGGVMRKVRTLRRPPTSRT